MKKALLLVLLFFSLAKLCKTQTHGFSIAVISSGRPYCQEWEISCPLTPDIETALSQSYTYLSRGGQAFVFLSQDGKTVLKFFKQSLYKPQFWAGKKKKQQKKDKLRRDFGSYKLAFEKLREESALLYIHLNKTAYLNKKILLTDRLGIRHEINCDDFDFILQRKGDLVPLKLMHASSEEAKKCITSLFELVAARCKKGFGDRDAALLTNCGFMGTRAIKIDIGRLAQGENISVKDELEKAAAPFRSWLTQTRPELLDYCDAEVKRCCAF